MEVLLKNVWNKCNMRHLRTAQPTSRRGADADQKWQARLYRHYEDILCGKLLVLAVIDMYFDLGNERLSLITTNKKYKLLIDLMDFLGEKRYAE